MEKSTKKFLSVLLSVAILLSYPIVGFAQDNNTEKFDGKVVAVEAVRNTLLSNTASIWTEEYVSVNVGEYEYHYTVANNEYGFNEYAAIGVKEGETYTLTLAGCEYASAQFTAPEDGKYEFAVNDWNGDYDQLYTYSSDFGKLEYTSCWENDNLVRCFNLTAGQTVKVIFKNAIYDWIYDEECGEWVKSFFDGNVEFSVTKHTSCRTHSNPTYIPMEALKESSVEELADLYYDFKVFPTCTEDGVHAFYCDICEDLYTETLTATGHDYQSKTKVEPTCTQMGVELLQCADCKDAYLTVVPAKGHTIVKDEAVAPTCTEAGKTEGRHCSDCGEVIDAQKVVPALGHTKVVDEAVAPTYFTTGKTEGSHCETCGEVLVAQKSVAKLTLKATTVTLKAAKKSFKVSYKKVADAKGYEIQYSTTKSMKGAKTVKVTSLSKSVKKLSSKKKYYVRVRAYTKSGSKTAYSAWSTVKSVKTK